MGNTKWTIKTYAAHNEALREAENKFQEERDRRYKEKDIERERALKIKEAADNNALLLAREIQTYKDEKANELREQINTERLLYARKTEVNQVQDKYDAILKPLLEFVSSHRGSDKGVAQAIAYVVIILGLAITIFGIYFK